MDERRVRDRASELRMLADGMSAPYIVPSTKETMALAMLNAARELDELADENAELHDDRERLFRKCVKQNHDVLDTYVENNELRELVHDIYKLCWNGLDCTECPKSFYDRCDKSDGCSWLGILHVRMRELGIEVD